MKTCKQCEQEKALDHFYKQSGNKDGRQGCCKQCMNSRVKNWYGAHPEIVKAKVKAYRKTPNGKKKHNERVKHRKKPYLKYREDKCRRCGFMPENVCQLTVDHIDRNRNNHNVVNLQTLCHNCHNLKSWVELYENEKLILLNLIPSTSKV